MRIVSVSLIGLNPLHVIIMSKCFMNEFCLSEPFTFDNYQWRTEDCMGKPIVSKYNEEPYFNKQQGNEPNSNTTAICQALVN